MGTCMSFYIINAHYDIALAWTSMGSVLMNYYSMPARVGAGCLLSFNCLKVRLDKRNYCWVS